MDRAAFEAELREKGYSEVAMRDWKAGEAVPEHVHPWDARVLVLEGEVTLTCGSEARTCRAGDVFELAANTPHTELYGPAGAKFLSGRRPLPKAR